ncbi:TadE/TadG family type IV pilus assembly protein [Promicromonospora sp. NPDC052451]|uniref:TadE/TadG family type IV pilus assembly protein n=1 Tax=Promicromonospora sp. NPDC052451 TaxID=3364407 RepID=UPI0037CC093A
MPGDGGERGQAAVELVGLVFALVLVGLLAIQGITVAQTASIAQEAARNGARALSLGQDARAEVERSVPDGLDVREVRPVVDDGTARVRVTVSAPLGLAGMTVVDVALTRTAAFPMAFAGED